MGSFCCRPSNATAEQDDLDSPTLSPSSSSPGQPSIGILMEQPSSAGRTLSTRDSSSIPVTSRTDERGRERFYSTPGTGNAPPFRRRAVMVNCLDALDSLASSLPGIIGQATEAPRRLASVIQKVEVSSGSKLPSLSSGSPPHSLSRMCHRLKKVGRSLPNFLFTLLISQSDSRTTLMWRRLSNAASGPPASTSLGLDDEIPF
jgi:hypothetical protein